MMAEQYQKNNIFMFVALFLLVTNVITFSYLYNLNNNLDEMYKSDKLIITDLNMLSGYYKYLVNVRYEDQIKAEYQYTEFGQFNDFNNEVLEFKSCNKGFYITKDFFSKYSKICFYNEDDNIYGQEYDFEGLETDRFIYEFILDGNLLSIKLNNGYESIISTYERVSTEEYILSK